MALQVNRRDLARVLSVSMPTITDWVDKGMPVVNRGTRGIPWVFDVATCVRWRLDYELANAKGAESRDITREDAERRSIVADAILKEIKLAELQRSVVRIEEVSRIWEGRIVASRETFLGLGARLAPQLVGETDQVRIETVIDDEVARALNEMAEWEPDEEIGEDDAGGDDPDRD